MHAALSDHSSCTESEAVPLLCRYASPACLHSLQPWDWVIARLSALSQQSGADLQMFLSNSAIVAVNVSNATHNGECMHARSLRDAFHEL